MNWAHVHLMVTHIPVIGIPMGLAFLLYTVWSGNSGAQRFALLALVSVAVFTIFTYLSGDPAEGVVEHLPGVTESFIEPHEEAAIFSLVASILTGTCALGALLFWSREQIRRRAVLVTIGIALISMLSLAYTANLGGKIRHTEIRAGAVTPAEDQKGE